MKLFQCELITFQAQAGKIEFEKTKRKKLVNFRSLSTPDFKLYSTEVRCLKFEVIVQNILSPQVSSPYVNLEMLDDPECIEAIQSLSRCHQTFPSNVAIS